MAQWKKVIVSGSAAELGSLTVQGAGQTGYIVNRSTISGTRITGSFSGSFKGDGSQLTGLPSGAVASYTNPGDNRIITSTDASTINGEANLTFDGSLLTITGRVAASSQITGSALQLLSLPAGTDNTVLVLNSTNNIVTDEIDARVWGATLVDNAGGNSANTRVAYWSDADSLAGNASFTYNGTILTVGSSTFGTNVVVAGDLTVLGDTFNVNVANLNVEDRFILLNSGSASGDGGIIVQNNSATKGFAFGFDDSVDRWGFQGNVLLHATGSVLSPEAYVSAVIDVDNGLSDIALYQKNGNIMINSGDIYIYA